MLNIVVDEFQRRSLSVKDQHQVETFNTLIDWILACYLEEKPNISVRTICEADVASALIDDDNLNLSYYSRTLAIYNELKDSGICLASLARLIEKKTTDSLDYFPHILKLLNGIEKRHADETVQTKRDILRELERGATLPAIFKNKKLLVHDCFRLTPLENKILLALKKNGYQIEFAVLKEASLEQGLEFETVDDEVAFIIAKIYSLLSESHSRIAIVLRRHDEFAETLFSKLREFGISYKSMLRKSAGTQKSVQFLLSLLNAKVFGIDTKNISTLCFGKFPETSIGMLKQHLRLSGCSNSLIDEESGKSWLEMLESLKSHSADDAVSKSQELIEVLQCELDSIPKLDTHASYCAHALKIFNQHDPALTEVTSFLDEFSNKHGTKTKISVESFYEWLRSVLSNLSCKSQTPNEYAVEVITPKEALSKEFDTLFLPNSHASNYPSPFRSDRFMSDDIRQAINAMYAEPKLVYDEKPLNDSSDTLSRSCRAKLEFSQLLARSKQKSFISFSKQTVSGVEQSPSPYIKQFERPSFTPYNSPRRQRVALEKLEALRESSKKICAPLFQEKFSHKLGISSEKPLSPTRIEAIAECRMKAYLEKFLNIDTKRERGPDVDVMWFGNLAHKVLEKYYLSRKERSISQSDFGPGERNLLSSIFSKSLKEALVQYINPNLEVLEAMAGWLEESILRLVSALQRDPLLTGVSPKLFEYKFSGESSLKMQIGDQSLHFGGIVDRIDWGPNARVVIDYKTSNRSAIMEKVRKGNLFEKHFQLPLYLRLVEHRWPTTDDVGLYAYLASIRDGVPTRLLGLNDEDFRERILDDSREDGLNASLQRVLTPFIQGDISYSEGQHCNFCRLSSVCRKNEKVQL